MAVNVRNVDWKNTIGKMIVKNARNVGEMHLIGKSPLYRNSIIMILPVIVLSALNVAIQEIIFVTIGQKIVKNALNVVKLERYNTTGFQIVKHVQSVRRSAMVI
jgi:hypothetical protein